MMGFNECLAMTGASDYYALRGMKVGFECVFLNAPRIEAYSKFRASTKWYRRREYRSSSGYTAPIYLKNLYSPRHLTTWSAAFK